MNSLSNFSRTCVHHVQILRRSSKNGSSMRTSQSIKHSRTRALQLSQRRSFVFSSQQSQHDISSSSQTSATNTTEAILSTLQPQQHKIPPSSTSSSSSSSSTTTVKTHHQQEPKLFTGTVSKAGTMQNCVQITHNKQYWNSYLRKNYTRPTRLLVHDPNPTGFLREGDVIQYSAWSETEVSNRLTKQADFEAATIAKSENGGETYLKKKEAKQKIKTLYNSTSDGRRRTGYHGEGQEKWVGPRYVFRRIISPFGEPLENRPVAENH